MKKEKEEITNILRKINLFCYENKIVFIAEQNNDMTNKIERVIENDMDTIKLILNDVHDANLINLLSNFYIELK